MRFLDRRAIKRSARDLIRERGGGVLTVTFLYLLLTDVLTTLLNLVFTNPLVLIQDQWSQSLESILQPWLEAGGGPEPDLTPAYSATVSFARQTLFNPRQEAILFLFLLLFLYTLVVSYGYSHWALRQVRGERPGWTGLFDCFWMAGKFILLELLTLLLVGVGLAFFVLPGLYFLYSLRMARYILLDNPELNVLQAMGMSRQLTRGYKGQIFTLDLSFLGWIAVSYLAVDSAFSAGANLHPMLGLLMGEISFLIFQVYIAPYRELSLAGYYESMRSLQLNQGQEVSM
jgi:hypothetical protein